MNDRITAIHAAIIKFCEASNRYQCIICIAQFFLSKNLFEYNLFFVVTPSYLMSLAVTSKLSYSQLFSVVITGSYS